MIRSRFRALCAHLVAAGALLVLATAHGAPVPPPPKALSAERLVGRWDYAFGPRTDGRIWLHADGTYAAVHEPEASTIYHGRWWLNGQVLELQEWAYSPGMERESGPMAYRFDFARGLGAGICGGNPVRLTNRVRAE